MKLLEIPVFEAITNLLSENQHNCHVDARIESYSCKMIGDDKKLFKEMASGGEQNMPLSPPIGSGSRSYSRSQSSDDDSHPFSSITCSQKTHFFLRNTLNKSFYPDYDFTSSPSSDFTRELSCSSAMNCVDNVLLTIGGSNYSSSRDELWMQIDKEIGLNDCEIYSYSPDLGSGPFSEPGVLWSFNYFFYNKKMKRIVYICCIARSGYQDTMDSNWEEAEMEMEELESPTATSGLQLQSTTVAQP